MRLLNPGLSKLVPAAAGLATAAPVAAHEAWLLSPAEIAHLEQSPMPELFASPMALALAAAGGVLVVGAALRAERMLRPLEARLFAPVARRAPDVGPAVIRLGLALMLALAAVGGLPRHGTERWAEPTLFVPDMELSLAPGWSGLAAMELGLAVLLAAGILTRVAGLGVVALALLGLGAFGAPFLDYALHFVVPGLILATFGGGALSADRAIGTDAWLRPAPRVAARAWTAVFVLMGGGFVYLGLTCKLAQPMLLMAILEAGGVPLFGLPVAFVALVMTGVELVAGGLLALGRLTRPIALFLIGAFTFFAVVLGENPLFHANLYGVMVMLFLSGRELPAVVASPVTVPARPGLAKGSEVGAQA